MKIYFFRFLYKFYDEFADVLRKNAKYFVILTCLLVLGFVVGATSGVKPIDSVATLSQFNSNVYGLIVQANFAKYFFGTLISILLIVVGVCVIGRFAYSFIFISVIPSIFGYFQCSTIVLVFRAFGAISIPFIVFYSVFTLLIDFVLLAYLSIFFSLSCDRKKYGCFVRLVGVIRLVAWYGVILGVLCLLRTILLFVFASII